MSTDQPFPSAPPPGTTFRRFLSAAVTANLGDGILSVAAPWLVSIVTRDPILLSLAVLASRLPWLVFTPFAGVIVDRVDRRRILIWADIVRGATLVAVTGLLVTLGRDLDSATGPRHQVLWLTIIYVSALVLGCAEVIRDTTAQAFVPRIVARDDLERANGRLWGSEMVANTLIGPTLGGVLVAASLALPFGTSAIAFVVSAAVVAAIPAAQVRAPRVEGPRQRTLVDLREGIRWLWGHPLLLLLAWAVGAMNFVSNLTAATMVLFGQDVLGVDATRYGLIFTGGAVGGIVGALTASKVATRLGSGPALALCVVAGTITHLAIGFASSWIVVWALFAFWNFSILVWNVVTVSLRQSIIPDALLGRVTSVYRWLAWGTMPIATLLGGVLVSRAEPWLGPVDALRLPYFVAAGLYVVMSIWLIPRLTTERIRAAMAEAPGDDPEGTAGPATGPVD